jgi:hypothetical protein
VTAYYQFIINDNLVKSQKTTFHEAGNPAAGGTLPPLEVNSSGSTFTPDRDLIVLGLMMDFYKSIIDNKIMNKDQRTGCRFSFFVRRRTPNAPAHCRRRTEPKEGV